MTTRVVVDLAGVSVSYGSTAALEDVDLRIGVGERVALVGSSGAGKTTLLDVLSGLAEPTSGAMRVLGVDPCSLRGRRLRAHRRRVGVIGQHLDLPLPLRVVHNVNAGHLGTWSAARATWSLIRPSGRQEAMETLARVGLADRLFSRTDSLSGGERQRVAVARVLAQRPSLVLADEPTSSVDPHLADHVMALLCGPSDVAPWTTVVSVHDPELARRHATRLVGLLDGRIVFDGPPEEVRPTDLTALYRSQS